MTTARWTFVLVVLAVCAVTTSAVFAGKKPRPEPEHGNFWQAQYLNLGDTGFQAAVGPWGTKNQVYYSVSVEKKIPAGSSIYFEAKLSIAGLPKGFTKKPIGEVVKFDARTGWVTFDLGDQQVQYRIP